MQQSDELNIGVSDDVQNVGRGTLTAKDDAKTEVTGKVKSSHDLLPKFDGTMHFILV